MCELALLGGVPLPCGGGEAVEASFCKCDALGLLEVARVAVFR